jgi:hypothetical protein
MPEISTDLAWYPPEFPAQGRLPSHAALVGKNGKKQASLERQYRDELCAAADKMVPLPCCKTLHISLFFDGTGNNLKRGILLPELKMSFTTVRSLR